MTTHETRPSFPFSQVVGQDDAKLALMLLAVDPLIGGVLLRGEKGSAKTTLARGLAALLVADAPFVDLPLGATEDRLLGSLDITKALTEGDVAFTPGLLAEVDGGVLYVDEVNLLADHLVDTLLDVSVSGVNRVERDGVSHSHSAQFVLIGSMNPEEGELRPQLLDRFGLSVDIRASVDVAERSEAVRRRLSFDSATDETASDPHDEASTTGDELLRQQLSAARPANIPDALIEQASALAVAVGAEGLRADLVLCRAAAAYAGLEGRTEASEDDLRRVAPLVLAHRSRRNPFDPPMMASEQLDQALQDTLDGAPDDAAPDDAGQQDGQDHESDEGPGDGDDSEPKPGSAATSTMRLGRDRVAPMVAKADQLVAKLEKSPAGRRQRVESDRGRVVRDIAHDPAVDRPISVAGTVRQLAAKPGSSIESGDLRHAVKKRKAGSLLVVVVDTSGSMGATERAELATGTAMGLLTDAYQRRDHVAVVTFNGDGAEVVLQPTGSVEVARNRLQDLPTGGATPLAAGIRQLRDLVRSRRDQSRIPFCVVLTDGRASGTAESGSALDEALHEAAAFKRSGYAGLVLDCETGRPRLGLAAKVAEAMGVECVAAADLDSAALATTIRNASEGSRNVR